MKKSRAASNKCINFFIDFSLKNNEKSSPKVRKTLFARKFDEKSLPGDLFGATDWFLGYFGVPEGIHKFVKRGDTSRQKWSCDQSGSHFGRFSALFSILAPLFVNSTCFFWRFWWPLTIWLDLWRKKMRFEILLDMFLMAQKSDSSTYLVVFVQATNLANRCFS